MGYCIVTGMPKRCSASDIFASSDVGPVYSCQHLRLQNVRRLDKLIGNQNAFPQFKHILASCGPVLLLRIFSMVSGSCIGLCSVLYSEILRRDSGRFAGFLSPVILRRTLSISCAHFLCLALRVPSSFVQLAWTPARMLRISMLCSRNNTRNTRKVTCNCLQIAGVPSRWTQ